MKWFWILFGKWRVLYDDGQVSDPMRYRTAKDYAKIFGGTVVRAL